MILISCGADHQGSSELVASDDTNSFSVALKQDMPACNPSRENQLVMVEEEGVLYVCKSKQWQKSELSPDAVNREALKGDKGEKGDQGETGAAGAAGSAGEAGEDADSLYMEVSDASLSSIASQAAGKKISLYFTGVTTINHSSSLRLSGQGNFVTMAGDVFEFVSIGNGWKELSRAVGGESYIRTRTNNLTTDFTTGWNKLIYNDVVDDNQVEYNTTTGDFTAKQKGVYAITAGITTDVYTWTAGSVCGLAIYVNGTLVSQKNSVMPAVTLTCSSETAKSVELSPGDTVHIKVYMSRSTDPTLLSNGAEYNSLTITKVR
jgi:hypothetical protein